MIMVVPLAVLAAFDIAYMLHANLAENVLEKVLLPTDKLENWKCEFQC